MAADGRVRGSSPGRDIPFLMWNLHEINEEDADDEGEDVDDDDDDDKKEEEEEEDVFEI